MKTIQVKIRIGTLKRVDTIVLEKTGDDEEMEVLASGISTLFLKSKDALAIAQNNGDRVITLAPKRKK